MADCLLLLLQGDFLTGLTCTWTNVIGLWFYAIALAVLEITLAIKYENITAPAVIGIMSALLMVNFLPTEMMLLPIGILVVNVAAVFYNRILGE